MPRALAFFSVIPEGPVLPEDSTKRPHPLHPHPLSPPLMKARERELRGALGNLYPIWDALGLGWDITPGKTQRPASQP